MDRRIENNLEDWLRGSLPQSARSEFESVLREDEETRRMVEAFERHARMMRETLRPAQELDPAAGFYARVMDRIEAQRGNSFWGLLLEPLFFRRVAMASAALLVLMGVMLVSPREDQTLAAFGSGVENFLAENGAPAPDPAREQQARNRDALLVNLTTYGE